MGKLLIAGTGGLAREFTAWFAGQFDIVGYTSTDASEHGRFALPGRLFGEDVTPAQAGCDQVVVAIGSPAVRMRLHAQLAAQGFGFPRCVHPSSVVAGSAVLHEGVVVSPQCVVGPQAELQRLCYLNFSSGVGHDAVVGGYAQLNPGCQLGGHVRIGEGSLVGSGATVLQRVKVGAGATVGSGSVVFARVADGVTVLGNPARRMPAFEQP